MPLTASSPMSPPGNRMGETTNESVVNARRSAPISMTAASLSTPPGEAAASAGARTSRMSAAESWPPDPWPRITRASSAIGAGQVASAGSIVARGSSMAVIAAPPLAGTSGVAPESPPPMPIPRPAAWNAAHVPSDETIGAPSGIRGVHSVPYAVQSSGVASPVRIAPAMHAGCSRVLMSPTSNRRSASNRA